MALCSGTLTGRAVWFAGPGARACNQTQRGWDTGAQGPTCSWMSMEGHGPGVRARAEPHVVLCPLEQCVPAVLHGKVT